MKTSDGINLLEHLASATDCMFLSDLHAAARLPLIREAVSGCSAQSYPLRDWIDAARYISGETVTFQTQEEAKAYLSHYKPRR